MKLIGSMVVLAAVGQTPPKVVQVQPPVLVTPPAYVAPPPREERFGDWTLYPIAKGAMTSTTNESGSAFGVVCTDVCTAFVNFRTRCNDGDEHPALVNSKAGSYTVTLRCKIIDGRYLMSLPLSSTLVDSMSIGGEVAFAFPLESGQFSVARFSLAGALRAAGRALEYGKARGGAAQQKGLKDYTL